MTRAPERTPHAAPRSSRLLLAIAAVAVAFAAADTYVVCAGAARHDDRRRHPHRRAAARRSDRQRVPPRLRRDAAAHRPDRRPARPGAGAGDGAGPLRRRLAGHDAGLRHAQHRRRALPPGRRRRRTGPATLALVADLYPAERRGVPLGVVSAVQEIGSVLGPLFGAAVLAVADWRAIFAVNLAVGLVLVAAVRAVAPRSSAVAGRRHPPRRSRCERSEPRDPASTSWASCCCS